MQPVKIKHCQLKLHRRGAWCHGVLANLLTKNNSKSLYQILIINIINKLIELGLYRRYTRVRINLALSEQELITLLEPNGNSMQQSIVTSLVEQIQTQLHTQKNFYQVKKTSLDDLSQAAISIANDVPAKQQLLHYNNPVLLLARWHIDDTLFSLLNQFTQADLRQWLIKILSQTISDFSQDKESESVKNIDINAYLKKQKSNSLCYQLLSLFAQFYAENNQLISYSSLAQCLGNNADLQIRKQWLSLSKQLQLDNNRQHAEQNKLHAIQAVSNTERDNIIWQAEITLDSIFPFIVLSTYASIACLETLQTTLAANNLYGEAHKFAASFAYKLLPAKKNHCYRSPIDQNTVAAFCGIKQLPSDAAIVSFAKKFLQCHIPLTSYIESALAQGHEARHAILIKKYTYDEQDYVFVLDTQDDSPICWFNIESIGSENQDRLPDLVQRFKQPLVLLDQSLASFSMYQYLNKHQIQFISNAQAGRNELLRRIGRRKRYWTNDFDSEQIGLLKAASTMGQSIAIADKINKELVDSRYSCNSEQVLPYEQALAVNVSLPLSTIAWELWRRFEKTNPLLAFNHFQDLAGKVVFAQQTVTVYPALGQRYLDLRSCHLLQDVPCVSWLANRDLVFAGV